MPRLDTIPLEVFSMIITKLYVGAILAVRQVNRVANINCQPLFAREFLTHQDHRVSLHSLQLLRHFCSHQVYGRYVTTIRLSAVYEESFAAEMALTECLLHAFASLRTFGQPLTLGIYVDPESVPSKAASDSKVESLLETILTLANTAGLEYNEVSVGLYRWSFNTRKNAMSPNLGAYLCSLLDQGKDLEIGYETSCDDGCVPSTSARYTHLDKSLQISRFDEYSDDDASYCEAWFRGFNKKVTDKGVTMLKLHDCNLKKVWVNKLLHDYKDVRSLSVANLNFTTSENFDWEGVLEKIMAHGLEYLAVGGEYSITSRETGGICPKIKYPAKLGEVILQSKDEVKKGLAATIAKVRAFDEDTMVDRGPHDVYEYWQ